MVHGKEFGHLLGELVELIFWGFSLVVDLLRRDTMSRCFPFPPPGYEAKPRSEHKDLLKKEKHKEKKHIRERKHTGKRERKEKDRDHKKDKHNKKHKRGKHRDRRKNKDIDEDKRQTLEQETQKNDDLGNRRPKERVQNEVVKDIKPTDEFTQILGQEGHANHTGGSTSKLLPRRTEIFGVAGSKEKERTSLSRVVEKSGETTQRNHASEKGKDTGHGSKTRIQNGKSHQVGSAEKHSTRRDSSSGVGLQQERCLAQSSCDGVASTMVVQGGGRGLKGRTTPSPNALQRTEQVGQHSDSSSHSAYGKSDSMRTKGMTEKENGSANKFRARMDQQLVQGKDGTVQGKAKIKEVKANHHKGVKEREGDHDVKKRKAKDKNKEREKEKKGDVNEQKHKELNARGASKNNIDDLMESACLNEKNFTSDDVKKRKDLEANSSLHEHSMPMTKLPRMSPANPLSVNGETLKHYQGTASCFSTVPVGANTCEADRLQHSKECYNNGITGSHSLEEHKASVSSIGYDSNEVSLKPPHLDTKYLNKLYSVPAVDDCSGYIDQDWLFSGDRVDQKTAISKAAESPQVCAEAQLIDSADIVALPYVVPL